jgi:hypothetical protein
MAELYGAPLGIIAHEEMMQKNAVARAQVLKSLGDVQKVPFEIEKLQAESEHQRALSSLNAAQMRAAARKEQDAQDWRDASEEANKRLALIQQQQMSGRDATVADLRDGRVPDTSPLGRLRLTLQVAQDRNLDPAIIAGIAAKISEAEKDEAQALSSQAMKAEHEQKTLRSQAENLGAWASHAIKGPQEYAQAMAAARSDPRMAPLVQALPPTYGAPAAAALRQMIDGSQTIKEQSQMQTQMMTAKAAEARAGAALSQAGTAAMVGAARVENLKASTAKITKELGKNTQEAVDARTELTQARTEAVRARQLKDFPPAPLDPGARRVGRTYTGQDGQRYTWSQDAQGRKGWIKAPTGE